MACGQYRLSVPQQLRRGITAFEQIAFGQIAQLDGKSIDRNKRGPLVDGIRADLRCHNGIIEFLANQQAIIERYIEESGWPAPPPRA
ncbi:MAG: hypothetical protein ACREJN_01840 [Nitrospiraceae bacterium]